MSIDLVRDDLTQDVFPTYSQRIRPAFRTTETPNEAAMQGCPSFLETKLQRLFELRKTYMRSSTIMRQQRNEEGEISYIESERRVNGSYSMTNAIMRAAQRDSQDLELWVLHPEH